MWIKGLEYVTFSTNQKSRNLMVVIYLRVYKGCNLQVVAQTWEFRKNAAQCFNIYFSIFFFSFVSFLSAMLI
jgi:hypothetical protein